MRKIISKNPLFYAFLFPALTDGVITLLGQETTYYTVRTVNEASPAYYALQTSPWLFGVGSTLWFLFWYWVFKKLKEPLNLFLMFLFIAGHSWGSSSWIWKIMKSNAIYTPTNQVSVIVAWGFIVIYFSLIAIIATYSLKIYMYKQR